MNAEMLLLGLAPVVAFVAIEATWGLRAGIVASMVIVSLLAIYFFFRFENIDETFWVELVLIIVLGLVSLRLKDGKWFKFQPLVTGLILSAYVFYQQATGVPVLLKLQPMMVELQPEMAEFFLSPRTTNYFAGLSWQIGVMVAIHAVACGIAAVKLPSVGWMLTRLAIYPVMLVWMIIGQILFY